MKHDGVRWQAAVVCEVPDPEPKTVGSVVGVDVGLRRLATVHDGVVSETIDNPRPLKGALSKLRRVNPANCAIPHHSRQEAAQQPAGAAVCGAAAPLSAGE